MKQDIQLNLHDPIPGQEEIKANAQKACAGCLGYCCLAFSLSFKKSEIPQLLRKEKSQLAALLEREQRHRTILMMRDGHAPLYTEDGFRRIRSHESEIYSFHFLQTSLKPIKMAPGIRKSQRGAYHPNYWYGCHHYNWRKNRCESYETRPNMCKKYVCGPATEGQAPFMEDMQGQPKYFPGITAIARQSGNKPIHKPREPKLKGSAEVIVKKRLDNTNE